MPKSRKGRSAWRGRLPPETGNRFSILRYRLQDLYGDRIDIAVPVIDHVPLYEHLPGRYPGVLMSLVVPPAHHWLGEPHHEYIDHGRPVILDGYCGCAGCCGVMARIDISPTTVVWHDFYRLGDSSVGELRFVFDRLEYEAALAKLPNLKLTTEPWMQDPFSET